MAAPALEVENLSYSYGRGFALDKIGFSIQPGEFTALLGPNGAGKTTLFSLITRLFEASEGRIRVCGADLHAHPGQALTRLDMIEREDEKVRQLNGGHRRRVELARSLLHRPSLLVLDEPTVGLDVSARRSIVEHVHDLCSSQGIAVLWATHLIDEVFPDDRVIVIHKGRLLADGDVAEVNRLNGCDTLTQTFHRLIDQVTP